MITELRNDNYRYFNRYLNKIFYGLKILPKILEIITISVHKNILLTHCSGFLGSKLKIRKKMVYTFYTETMLRIGFKRDHLKASKRLKAFQVRSERDLKYFIFPQINVKKCSQNYQKVAF